MKKISQILAAIFIFIASTGQATPLNSSLILNDFFDYENCPNKLVQAKALGNKKIHLNFFVNAILDSNNKISDLCIVDETRECQKADNYHFDTIKYFFGLCLEKAVELNLDIAITPYIEHKARAANFWRNYFFLDPSAPIGDYSYRKVTLDIILDTIEKNIPKSHSVELSLQGEMGGSIAHAPAEYLKILTEARSRFKDFNIKYGISLNFDEVFGSYPQLSQNKVQIETLINKLDFLGVSAYHAVKYPVKPSDFRASLDNFFVEIQSAGIKVSRKMPIRLTEVGLGGGNPDKYNVPASSPRDAAATPWAGVRGPYSLETDPWSFPKMKEFRLQFHVALLEFLKNPRTARPIMGAFLWNQESWDVQGLGYAFDKYADPEIIKTIKTHNSAY